MSTKIGTTGAKRVLNSLGVAKGARERLFGHIIAGYTGWLLAVFVAVVYLVSGEPLVAHPEVLWWLGVYVAYQAILMVLSRYKRGLYETPLFRMVRIQLTAVFSTILVWLTGGSQSPFWYVYLWPIFAAAIYFESRWVTFAVYGEAAVLYFLASLGVGRVPSEVDFASLLVNLSIMLMLSAVLRYLMESIRMYQVAEAKLKHSEILQQIQQDIDSAVGLQEVLDRILRRAVELVGTRDGSLMLMDEEGKLCFRARVGELFPEDKEKRGFEVGEGIAGWVALNRKPCICHDTRTDTVFVPIIPGSFPIRSLVSVPIISHGTVLGVINVDGSEPYRFSAADAELLATLANQTAVAIERAELLDSLRQIAEKTLGGAEDLYQHIVEAVYRLTHCPVAMWRVNEHFRTQATIHAHKGLREEYVRDRVLDLATSIVGEVIRKAEPWSIDDVQDHLRVSNETKAEAASQGWKSILVMPLLAGPGRAVGTLSIYSLTRKEFTPWEVDLLQAFTSQAGVAIQNAERLQTIQRLNEVGQSLTTLQESPEVLRETLQRIANAALEVLGADVVDLYQYRADRDDFVLPPIMVGERLVPGLVPTRLFPDDVVVRIAHTGEPVCASDARGHPVLAGDWELPREKRPKKRFVVREEIISSAAVPMKVGEEVLGIMFAGYRQRRDFATDVELRERIEVLANQGAIAINNARLVQRLRDRADEVGLLQQVGAQISAALKLGEVLPSLVEGAMRLTKTRSGVVHAIDSSGENIVASYAYPEEFRHPAPRISEQGYTRLIIEKGEQRVVPDTQLDTRVNPEVVKKGVKSFVGIPLKLAGERVVGVLYLNDTTVRHFTKGELALLRALADQAAVAIEHARLFQELDERATQFERLHKVTATISAEPPELVKVLDLIVDSLSDIFEGASCAIRLYDSKTDSFSPQKATGVFKDSVDYPPRSNGTSRHVINSKTPRYIEDTSIVPPDGGPAVRTRFVQQGVRAIALLPLLSGADVTGILYVGLTSPHRFFQNDKHILELFADQAAIAIENARLFEEREDRIRDLSVLFDISQGLSSGEPLTVHDMSQLLYDEASNLMGMRNFYTASYDRDRDLVAFEFVVENGEEVRTRSGEWAPRISGNGLTEQVIRKGGALYIPSDVGKWREDQGVYDGLRDGMPWDQWKKSRDATVTGQSWLGIPIKVGDEILGVIGVQNYERTDAYDKYDQQVLSTVAAQLGIAMIRQRLDQRNEELDCRNKELQVLPGIYEKVIAVGIEDVDRILDLLYEEASKVMDLSDAQVQIAFYDEVKDEVTFPLAMEQDNGEVIDVVRWSKREAEYGEEGEDEIVKQFRPRPRGERFGLTEYVIHTREPVLIVENFMQEAESRGIQVWPTFGRLDRPTHSWLGVPMIVQDRVTGIVSIQSLETERAFEQGHQDLLTTVASQAAVAIENARLYDDLEAAHIELEQAQEQRIAAEKFAHLGTVAAALGHRMNSVAGMVRLCERELRDLVDLENEEISDNMDTIAEEVAYMLGLAEGLFMPTQAIEEQLQPTDLNLLLRDAVDKAHIPPDIDTTCIYCDGLPLIPANKWFVEMFVELIVNAITAMEDGKGQLRVESRLDDDRWTEILITDNGCGIPPQDREHIFNLFFSHREEEYVDEEEGIRNFGFGLWWIKTFLIGIGGSIDFESEIGKGTTFVVKLPVGGRDD